MTAQSLDIQDIFEADPRAVAVLAPECEDFVVLATNQRYLDALGRPRDQVIGAKLTACLEQLLDAHSVHALVETLARVNLAPALAEPLLLTGGERRFYSYNSPIRDERGHVSHILHHLQLPSDNAKPAPHSTHPDSNETQFLRQVIEDSPYAVAMFDSDMRYLYASERWSLEHNIKLSRAQLRGRSHYDVFRDTPAQWKNIHRRALAGEVVREETEVRHPADGALQWWLWEVRPWFGPDHSVQGILIYTEDVSATKYAHDALRASEARFRSTFENAAVGISHVGLDTSWLRVNDKLCNITGYSREELLALKVMDVTHPDDRAADLQAAEQLNAGMMQTFIAEKRYIRRDRSIIWVSVTVSLMRTADGEPDYYISFVTDIGARKAATLALRESEARFRALADNMSQLAWIADETGARFWFNRRWTEYTGTQLTQVYDWRWPIVHAEAERDAIVADYRERFAVGQAWTDTYQLLDRDGRARWFLTQVVPLRDEGGTIIRWFGTHTDITAERAAQRALERGRFFELSLDLVCITDTEGVFLQLSPSFTSVLGYPLSALLGHSILDFVVPEDRAATQQALTSVPSEVPTLAFTHRFRCADGSLRWLQWRWAPSPGGMNYAMARDVTADREILLSLQQAERELRNKQTSLTNSLREREVLLQEIHHRVKNNLQVISSLINMQARRLTAPSARAALDECKTRIETIALIHEQLYKSRDYQCISFSDYLRGLVRNIARVAGASTQRVGTTVESEPITLPVDKAIPFGLILHELITNAFKHAFPQERCGEIRVALRKTAEGIELSVADNGVGMSMPILPTAGTGSLGMQLIETLVEQLDGKLSATQADGMTFRITCPIEGKPS